MMVLQDLIQNFFIFQFKPKLKYHHQRVNWVQALHLNNSSNNEVLNENKKKYNVVLIDPFLPQVVYLQ
jgi:tRNA G26 N,N-dimethylase Trm1